MRDVSLRLHGKDTTRKYNEHQYKLGQIKKRIKKEKYTKRNTTNTRVFRVRGSPGRTRTSDRTINSRLLYQLSYRGTAHANELAAQNVATL